jgi:hypothetical protein
VRSFPALVLSLVLAGCVRPPVAAPPRVTLGPPAAVSLPCRCVQGRPVVVPIGTFPPVRGPAPAPQSSPAPAAAPSAPGAIYVTLFLDPEAGPGVAGASTGTTRAFRDSLASLNAKWSVVMKGTAAYRASNMDSWLAATQRNFPGTGMPLVLVQSSDGAVKAWAVRLTEPVVLAAVANVRATP